MHWILIIAIMLLILIFIPIPVKATFIYNEGCIELFLYRFKFNLNKKKEEVKEVAEQKKEEAKEKEKKKRKERKFDLKKLGPRKILSIIQKLYSKLSCNKFKIRMKSDIQLAFGLDDAAYTAILYGASQNAAPILYKAFDTIFKLKKFDFNVEPDFQNPTLKVKMDSIFFISLANVIYMAYILYKYLMLPIKKMIIK